MSPVPYDLAAVLDCQDSGFALQDPTPDVRPVPIFVVHHHKLDRWLTQQTTAWQQWASVAGGSLFRKSSADQSPATLLTASAETFPGVRARMPVAPQMVCFPPEPADNRPLGGVLLVLPRLCEDELYASPTGASSSLVAAPPLPDRVWDFAMLSAQLPTGVYAFADPDSTCQSSTTLVHPTWNPTTAALGWALGAYRFDIYTSALGTAPSCGAMLVWPEGADRRFVRATARALTALRHGVNTPAQDMGPAELAAYAQAVAACHNVTARTFVGDELKRQESFFPLVHLVGQGSHRPPHVVEFTWGNPRHPRISLVGKGVCFDSGGLNIKPDSNMLLMKKDMAGAAHALALAHILMATEQPLYLHVIIPCVDNAVSSQAMRPLDVARSRCGVTVEVGHTDAEGRLVMADALTAACEHNPAMIIDFSTLTGSARSAVGTEMAAFFTNRPSLGRALMNQSHRTRDPLWELPLWQFYRRTLVPAGCVADTSNVQSNAPFAGAITAALFLETFVSPTTPWIHLDMMGWNAAATPGCPVGAWPHGILALEQLLHANNLKNLLGLHSRQQV